MDPPTASDKPGRLPTRPAQRALVLEAYRRAYEDGHDPREVPVLVDVDCSPKYATVGINIAKTLTRSRGGTGGPWVSTRGRRTTLNEMQQIMGLLPGEVPRAEAGGSKRQFRMLLGNAVALPVLGRILSRALHSAG